MGNRTNWAWSPREREQVRVMCLDKMIAPDDSVRMVDEVLGAMDWTAWEERFASKRGQPPIHPRIVASIILYGMYRGIRSSRKLEDACNYRLDFRWLSDGLCPDHSTLATFRTRFHKELKGLFKQIGHMAMTMGLITLGEVAFDATRVKANNSRYRTLTGATLKEKLRALDELFEQLVAQAEQKDADTAGEGSSTRLPAELASVEQRRERIRAALEMVNAADEARRRQGIDPAKNPAQIPLTDPDSRVMPNKDGGYAPNYTPIQTTDGHSGFILDADVIQDVNESGVALASVDRIEETFGARPARVLTDAGNNSGPILEGMEQREIEILTPVQSQQPSPGHPAYRDDPSQPVADSVCPKLPRNSQGLLDKSCFTYDVERDQYYCPQGQVLSYEETKWERRRQTQAKKRIYRCHSCVGCPLYSQCISNRNKRGRTISRDQFERVRERVAARMSTSEAKAVYLQRPRIAETTFGIIKAVMGFRQFLLRGLEKVKTEWLWAATSFNLIKLARHLAQFT